MKNAFCLVLLPFLFGVCCGCTRGDASSVNESEGALLDEKVSGLSKVNGRTLFDASVEIRDCAVAMTNDLARREFFDRWTAAILSDRVISLEVHRRGLEIEFARDAVEFGVLDAMWKTHCSEGELWGTKFRLLRWMKNQIAALRPTVYDLRERENLNAWDAYESAVLCYENTVERFEIALLEGRMEVGETLDENWRVFEEVAGRPVRENAIVCRRGDYVRMAAKRIEEEKKSAKRRK